MTIKHRFCIARKTKINTTLQNIEIPEILGNELIKKHNLPNINESLNFMHNPDNLDLIEILPEPFLNRELQMDF